MKSRRRIANSRATSSGCLEREGRQEKFRRCPRRTKRLKDPEKRAAYDQSAATRPRFPSAARREQQFNHGQSQGGFSFDEVDLADLFAGLGGGARGFRGVGDATGRTFRYRARTTTLP